MQITLLSYKKLIFKLLMLVFFLSSCVDWDKKVAEYSIIRTDIRVRIIVKGAGTDLAISNQEVNWSIHLFNGSTDSNSNLVTGIVITDINGEAYVPVYECQLNAGKIARIIAFLPGQENSTITPLTVYFEDAVNDANDDDFAEINLDYLILK